MDEKRKEEETRELTPEEIDDMILEEQITSGVQRTLHSCRSSGGFGLESHERGYLVCYPI